VLERSGNMDTLTIEIEGEADAAARVQHHVKSMIGISATVVVKKPGEVPRSQGKAVRVRDLRPKPQ
jgi:phenylacetate-CoA ligase